jgi:flagellin
MRINTNIAAMNSWRNLAVSDDAMSKSLERLSSGYRINKASDDAAGLAIGEKMKAQVGGLKMAQRNAQDGISLIQTAEGGLSESSSILLRMRDLSNQATTATLETADRSKIVEEFQQLQTELTRISSTTKFNGTTLLSGGLGSSVGSIGTGLTAAAGITSIESTGASAATYTLGYNATTHAMTLTNGTTSATETITMAGGEPTGFNTQQLSFASMGVKVTVNAALSANIAANNTFAVSAGQASIQIGADGNSTLGIAISDMSASGLAVDSGAIQVDTAAHAQSAVSAIDTAIASVNTQRAKLGAYQNRLEHTISNLGTSIENLTSAQSRITDVDMAEEMAQFTKYQILQQAGTSMLAQANSRPQSVTQLLRG